jgi:hypothetical protein
MGLLEVARANTAVGVSPEAFPLLLLLQNRWNTKSRTVLQSPLEHCKGCLDHQLAPLSNKPLEHNYLQLNIVTVSKCKHWGVGV